MVPLFSATILWWLLHSAAFQKLSIARDTLLPHQSLGVGQTLVSQGHVFEMGFFSPGKSLNKFLGVWHTSTPDVVVWVANRQNPVTVAHSQGVVVVFMISGNGSLVISNGECIIWSANSSGMASSNPAALLLDTGNLVLVDSATESYVWQSFDHPTDTFLPGMKLINDADSGVERYLTSWKNMDDPSPGEFVVKIEFQGLPEIVILRGEKKMYRNGKWNGIHFSGVPRPQFPNRLFHHSRLFHPSRLFHLRMSFAPLMESYDNSILLRVTIHSSGLLVRYIKEARKDKWNPVFTYPQDTCDEYGACGPNGICSLERPIRCECLEGFAPKFPKDWDLQDWSGGCTRIRPLNCSDGDGYGFLEVRRVKYPDMLQFWLNMSMGLHECRAECLRNCSCIAYANPFVVDGGRGCVLWFGDLIDTRELATADSRQNIYIRLPISELANNASLKEEEEGEKKELMKSILISIASGVLVSGFINGGIMLVVRRKRRAARRNNEDIELPLFKIENIVAATNNFSSENIIGVGGFGPVYKGQMPAGEEIAVKRLSTTSGQGLEEFKNEVTLIAKLQHRNLVRLLGCCIDGEERMLIYEYLPNKSLDYFVFDQNLRTLLTWSKRFDIIMGIARGLTYLHHDSRLKIIHRDLKTSNILLDENLNPKISDFGLARIFEEEQAIVRTKKVVGTYGYMAPEYAFDGKFSVKSDVYSLGVVLLEIISGKKNRGFEHNDHHHSLLGHAWLLWRENRMLELLDECLNDIYMESQVKRCMHVGLLCVQKFPQDRPVMSSVLMMLGTDGAILAEPKEPGYFFERSCSPVQSFKSENGSITITDLEAR